MEYILIGKILNTFGIKGELKVELHTDFKEERYKEGSLIYVGEDHITYTCKGFRMHNDILLLTLKDLEDINLVEHLKGNNIYIKADELKPLDDGYYYKDLMNADVYIDNVKVGKVIDIENGISSNYIRVSKSDGKTSLIPILKEFIKDVDIKNNCIYIYDIKGLL